MTIYKRKIPRFHLLFLGILLFLSLSLIPLTVEGSENENENNENDDDNVAPSDDENDGEAEDDIEGEAFTPAHLYAQSADMINKLIEETEKEQFFKSDKNGWTPLHEAARAGNVLATMLLVDNGADPLAKTKSGETPRDLVGNKDFRDGDEVDDPSMEEDLVVSIILEHAEQGQGLDGSDIDIDVWRSDPDILIGFEGLGRILVQHGMEVVLSELLNVDETILEEEDSNGWSLLHEAARVGDIDMISFLTEIGADVTAKTLDGKSVLDIAHHFAEEVGSTTHVDFIRLLELQVDSVESDEELDEELHDDGMEDNNDTEDEDNAEDNDTEDEDNADYNDTEDEEHGEL